MRQYVIDFRFALFYHPRMKLSHWAKKNGLTYPTAWKLFRDGNLPVPAIQLKTGTILVQVPEPRPAGRVAVYARVSGSGQRADLERQVGRVCAFAAREGLAPDTVVSEVGSGMNGTRKRLLKLLADPEIGTIVVESRDRLTRFGFEAIEAALAAAGRRIVVMEPDEVESDLVRDMTEVLTSFCARLYGARSARHRARNAVAAAGAQP